MVAVCNLKIADSMNITDNATPEARPAPAQPSIIAYYSGHPVAPVAGNSSGDARVSRAPDPSSAIPLADPGPPGNLIEEESESMPDSGTDVLLETDAPPREGTGDGSSTDGTTIHANDADPDNPALDEAGVVASESSDGTDQSTGTWIPIDEILTRELSLYKKVTAMEAKSTIPVAKVAEFVRSDPGLQTSIERIRAEIAAGASDEAVRALKKELAAFTTSGVFSGRRMKGVPFEHTGLLQVDLDDVAPCDVDTIIERLRVDPHIVMVFRSPTSHHLKAIVAIPPDAALHSGSFEVVSRYFLDTYGARLDPATKDATRLCYFSSDSEIHVANGPVLQFEAAEVCKRTDAVNGPDSSQRQSGGDPAGPTGGVGGASSRFSARMVRSALALIAARGGRPDYDSWLRLISATRDAIEDDHLAITLLQELLPEESAGEYAEKFRAGLDRIPAKYLFDEAGKLGWKPMDGSLIDLCAMLDKGPEQRALERAPVIIDGLLRHGWLMLLAGRAKSRKSFLAIELALAVALGRNLFGNGNALTSDGIGFAVTRGNALFFDIENPTDEAAERLCAALEAIPAACERHEAARLIRLHALRGLELGNLTDAIIAEIRRSAVQGTLVIVDCFYPLFIGDVNDVAAVSVALRRFSNVAEEMGCGVVVIDHFRKGGNGSPGDQILGSVAKSMAPDAIVTMERRGKEDTFLISAELRGFPSFSDLVAHYDEGTRRFRLADPMPSSHINRALPEHRDLSNMRRAWQGRPDARLSRAECEGPWNVHSASARGMLSRMTGHGWVEQCGTGSNTRYVLTTKGQTLLHEGAVISDE